MSGYDEVASDFCAVCGTTHGRMEIHHIVRRSQGGSDDASNLVTLCRACHEQTDGDFLRFSRQDDGLWWVRDHDLDIVLGLCVFADPNRQEPSPEALTAEQGEALASLEECVLSYSHDANEASWRLSRIVRDAWDVLRDAYPDKEATKRLIEWGAEICDEDGNHRPISASTMRKLLKTASLPELPQVVALSLAERDRLYRAMGRTATEFDIVLSDLLFLSRDDFEFLYLGKKPAMEKARHECPSCGCVHEDKRVPFDYKEDE